MDYCVIFCISVFQLLKHLLPQLEVEGTSFVQLSELGPVGIGCSGLDSGDFADVFPGLRFLGLPKTSEPHTGPPIVDESDES